LGLLLKEIGDVREAVAFVEEHQAVNSSLARDLIDYSVKHPDFLADLLNYVGISSLNPKDVVLNVPKRHSIPNLRQKLLRIIDQYKFQVSNSPTVSVCPVNG
jgi:glucose/arabinose dehydrogenase